MSIEGIVALVIVGIIGIVAMKLLNGEAGSLTGSYEKPKKKWHKR